MMTDSEKYAGPFVAETEICAKDGTRYAKGDDVPAELVKANKWLVRAGKVK